MNISNVLGLRKHKRYLADFDVTMLEQVHRLNLKGRVKDMSCEGLLMYCRDSVNPGSVLDLSFQPPAVGENFAPAVRVSAKVTRCVLRSDGAFFEIAVNFKRFAEEHEVEFRRYLDRLGA